MNKLTSIKCLGSVYAILILSVNCTSAGLLQAIREAAVPKDMDYTVPSESVQVPVAIPAYSAIFPSQSLLPPSQPRFPAAVAVQHVVTPAEESSLLSTLQTSLSKLSSAIQERADLTANRQTSKQCRPNDLLCHSGFSLGTTMQNDVSSAIIKSFGSMMTDMVNTTISRGLGDFMAHHGSAAGETASEEHKAMIQMASKVLSTVSSRVIKAFTFFIQLAISGAMQDLLHQVVKGATMMYTVHQKSAANLRATTALNGPPGQIPKPSQHQNFPETDPIKAILNAGALTSLTYPGFDLMSSLKSNMFTGEDNSIIKRRGAPSPVLTPYGLLTKKK